MVARISLILGGARSGKSARALALAAPPKTFVATAEALDREMADRIAAHKAERGPDWALIEAPMDIVPAIRAHATGTLVIDCLTLWLSNIMHHELDVPAEVDRLCEALAGAQANASVSTGARVILVSNEVGLSIAPENALARWFRDEQGRLNQRVAAVADHVEFMAAGLPMLLKGAP